MRVLFQNRPKASWIGGDMVQLEKTMEAVAKLGVDVEFNDHPVYTPALRYRHFDIVHVYNFSMDWTKFQITTASISSKPVVASMIYHEAEEYMPYTEQQKLLDYIKAAVFLTPTEVERVKRHLKIDENKINIIGNGIDPFWFKTVMKGDTPPYVLTVGRIDASKGQLGAAQACSKIGIRYLMVGERKDEGYTKECEKYGAIWQAPLEPKDLIKLYASCTVFCLPSRAEIFPLTVMEAGAQGRPIVLTDNCEWKDTGAITCKWHDAESIESAIRMASLKNDNPDLKAKLQKMTWDDVGKQYVELYNRVLHSNA
jgi:glycosyltransferase involved in cell wall biosynthesis